MRGVLPIAAVGVAVAVVSGVSARGAELEAGKRELSVSGTFESVSGSGSALQLTAELGFLLTEHDEVGPTFALYHSSVGSDSFTGGSFGAFYRYNFVTKVPAQVPFLGFGSNGRWAATTSFATGRKPMRGSACCRLRRSR